MKVYVCFETYPDDTVVIRHVFWERSDADEWKDERTYGCWRDYVVKKIE